MGLAGVEVQRGTGPAVRVTAGTPMRYAAAVTADTPPRRALGTRLLEGPRAAALVTLVALAVAAVALALPLLTVEWLPFVDYPQHLGTIAAIHGQGDPAFARFFVVDYPRSQYLLLYVLGDGLASLLGVEGAGRATAILSIASLPLSVAVFLRAHGRPAMLGALAAPVAMHAYVFWGFLNYAAGMSLGVFTLAMAARVLRAPGPGTALAMALAALATFYAHAQLYAWMGLACVVQFAAMMPALGLRRSLRGLAASALAALPSLAAVGWWLRASDVLARGEAGSRSGHAAQLAAEGGGAAFVPALETVRGWLSHSFDVYRDGAGIEIAIAFFAVVLLAVSWRGPAFSPPSSMGVPAAERRGWVGRFVEFWSPAGMDAAPRSFAPEAVLALTFALYLFGPFSYRMIEPINHRFLPLALALLPVLGPRAMSPRQRWGMLVPLCALSIFSAKVHAAHFTETDREMGDLAEALDHLNRGDRVMGLMFDAQSSVVPLPLYLHAHQYFQARVGGLACFSFVEFPKSPVQYAPGAAPPPFPPRFEWTPERYDHGVWGDAFDAWLVRHAPGRPPPALFRRAAPGGGPTPTPVYEGERWTVYAAVREAR